GVELIRDGRLRPPIGMTLPLESAAEAHRLLGSRATTGKLVLAIKG
ncbi:MAG: zinc-binding dehydrogenase, partial [Chloroflexi bacterium]